MKYCIFFVFISFALLTSCYNDNEEDIYSKFNASLNCDTIDVNYEENIKFILNANCASCHDGSHPSCNLNNYTNARNYALLPNSNLYTYVENNTHKDAVLSDCELKQLKLWIENGAQ